MALVPIHIPWTSKPPLGTPIDRSHPLAQGVIGAWALNEGAGVQAFSEDRLRGTLLDDPTWAPNGLRFPGGTSSSSTKARVECGVGLVPAYDSNITILAAIQSGEIGAGGDDVIAGQCQSSGSVTVPGMGLGVSSLSGRLKVYWNNTVIVNSPTGALVSNEKCVLAAVFSGGVNARGYKNGIMLQNVTVSGAPSVDGKFLIGAHYRQSSNLYYGGFKGVCELILLINKALSPAEVAALSANPWQIYQPQIIWVEDTVAAGGFSGILSANQMVQSQLVTSLLKFDGSTAALQPLQLQTLSALLKFDGSSIQQQIIATEALSALLRFSGQVSETQAIQTEEIYQSLLPITGTITQTQAAQIATLTGSLIFGGIATQNQTSQLEELVAVLRFAGSTAQQQTAQFEALEGLQTLIFSGTVTQAQLIQAEVLTAILAFSGSSSQTQDEQRQIATNLAAAISIIFAESERITSFTEDVRIINFVEVANA